MAVILVFGQSCVDVDFREFEGLKPVQLFVFEQDRKVYGFRVFGVEVVNGACEVGFEGTQLVLVPLFIEVDFELGTEEAAGLFAPNLFRGLGGQVESHRL